MDDFTGKVMVALDGPKLTDSDRKRLDMPAVGAVCLFARNYTTTPELAKLVKAARKSVDKPLLVAVDHEGGRVQRFKGAGFTELPPARKLGHEYEKNPSAALHEAIERGATIARELAQVDIDLAFAPVLDIDYGHNEMIDSRCFASVPEEVAALALAFCQGMSEHGMKPVGKHFPGHGWVKQDSHLETPIDERQSATILANDVLPYRELVKRDLLGAVMLSHVQYRMTDGPATYSKSLVKQILRRDLGYKGKVVTDDLVMQGADCGGMDERVKRAAEAGCDAFLVVGGEPVLHDAELARLPASGNRLSPWLALVRGDKV